MRNRRSDGIRMRAAMVALVFSTTGLVACGSQEEAKSDQAGPSEESVTIALTSVPASTLCIRVTATPATGTATVKSFIVAPDASSANLQMGVLLPGSYTLAADAFTVACTAISGAGTWIADPVSITVRAGVATSVTMTLRKNSPVAVTANFVNNVKSMAVGLYSSYIVTDSGILQTGDINNIGGTNTYSYKRTDFAAFKSSSVAGNALVAVTATYLGACAVRADGTVWCWGTSMYGELGPGVTADAATPVQVAGLSNATQIVSGMFHVCALATGNLGPGVYCWGANDSGELGDGSYVGSSTPVRVGGIFLFDSGKSLAAGQEASYLVFNDGRVYAWGNNSYGQLGDGSTNNQAYPVTVPLQKPVQSVSAGSYHACALAVSGEVYCWGDNFVGQLGDGTRTSRLNPTQVLNLTAKQVVSGQYHNCALTTSGDTDCWGWGSRGVLGDGSCDVSAVIRPVNLDGIRLSTLASGSYGDTACGFSTNLDVYCWGFNYHGNIGDGTRNDAFLPVRVQLP